MHQNRDYRNKVPGCYVPDWQFEKSGSGCGTGGLSVAEGCYRDNRLMRQLPAEDWRF